MEHPFFGSWGYQTTSYFAPTSSRTARPPTSWRSSTCCTRTASASMLDWVPSHFPSDEFALGVLRRHASLRARRSPAGLPSRLEHAGLQLRPATRCVRSSISSACFWLDRYHADGLRVDAVASMLYLDYSRERGEWVPNELRRPREPRRDVVPARAERRGLPLVPRRADLRRGVDRVAGGVAADVPRRTRLRREVGHGLDARHAAVLVARSDPPPLPPRRADVPRRLRVERELRAAAVARRGRARQGLAARRRCRATSGRSSRTCGCCSGTSGRSPGKKLLFMGGELGQWGEWNHDGQRRLGLSTTIRARRRRPLGRRPQPGCWSGSPALYELDSDSGGFRWAVADDARQQHARVPPLREGRLAGAVRRQLHAGAADNYRTPGAGRRLLARGAEQRRRDLRRLRRRQLRRRRGAARCRCTSTGGRSR